MDSNDLSIPDTPLKTNATNCLSHQCWTPQLLNSLLRSLVKVEARLPRPGPRGYPRAAMLVGGLYLCSGGRSTCSLPHEDDVRLLLDLSRWMLWLEESERHLLNMHAIGVPREIIGRKLGISRTSVWRRWSAAINKLVICLNCARIPPQLPRLDR